MWNHMQIDASEETATDDKSDLHPDFQDSLKKDLFSDLRLATSCSGASSPRLTQAAPSNTPCPTRAPSFSLRHQKSWARTTTTDTAHDI